MNRALPVLLAGMLGCVRTTSPLPPDEPYVFNTLGSHAHATPVATRRDRSAPVPPELPVLAQAIDGLRHGGEPTTAELVGAINALAAALVLVDPTRRDNVAAIHSVAERMADAPRGLRQHADLARSALERTRSVFARSTPRDRTALPFGSAAGRAQVPAGDRWRMREYVVVLTRFTDDVKAIDPERSLLAQRSRIEAALANALTVIEVAVGVAAR